MKITFSCDENMQGVIPEPKAALKFAPAYFKGIKPQSDNNPKNGTVKRCVPFLDALSQGFIIPLWADMWVFTKDGEITVEFPTNFPQPETLGQHGYQQVIGHPLKDKPYGRLPMKFINPWLIETDEGVSCLFTSPLNHLETRFKILDGVVDTDTYYNNVNFPFLWTGGDGEFFIKKGTPLVQVIPFRREDTELTTKTTNLDKRSHTQAVLGTKLRNGYRDEFWHKKKTDSVEQLDLQETVEPIQQEDQGISIIEDNAPKYGSAVYGKPFNT